MLHGTGSCLILANRYEVLQSLGSGGMSRVHDGLDLSTRQRVAIKIAETEKNIAGLRLEEAALRRLQGCAHVVQLLDAGSWDKGHFLVLERLDGPDLGDVLVAQRYLEAGLAGQSMLQVLEALKAVHGAGLIHCDVKPENIVRSGHGVALIDFGVACFTDQKRYSTGGTMTYVSPESLDPSPSFDHRRDLYACGHVLYETLTGRHAILGANTTTVPVHAVLKMQMHLTPPPFAEAAPDLAISPELEHITFKALEKDPEDRFQSAEEMHAALLAAL